MNKTTLSNLTHNELISLDPEQEPGVYEEVFKRFIKLNPQDEFKRGVEAQKNFNDRLRNDFLQGE